MRCWRIGFTSILLLCMLMLIFVPAEELHAREEDHLFVQEIYNLLSQQYVHEIDPALQKCKSVSELLNQLDDPYTEYFNVVDYRDFLRATEGSFSGVGMELEQDGEHFKVVRVLPSSPAAGAGVKAGDCILEVNGENLIGANLNEVILKIRGEPGTSVMLTLKHENDPEPRILILTRKEIELDILETKMIGENIGYIRLTNFSHRSAGEVLQALYEIDQKGQALVLDLRQNPGGYLGSALQIANFFLPVNQPVLHVVSRGEQKETFYSKGRRWEKPLVVLIDGLSASASEIVAGAIQDASVGMLVGEKSFGKGSVQTIFKLSDGGALKVTTAKYLTPQERIIEGQGLIPDYVAPDLPDTEVDETLEKAVSLLEQNFKKSSFSITLGLIPGRETAFLNGEKWQMPANPYLLNGRILIPLKDFVSKLGAVVQWDAAQKKIVIRKGNLMMELKPNQKIATVNGVVKYLDVPIKVQEGRSFIPLRFLSEEMGYKVYWDMQKYEARILGF